MQEVSAARVTAPLDQVPAPMYRVGVEVAEQFPIPSRQLLHLPIYRPLTGNFFAPLPVPSIASRVFLLSILRFVLCS